MSTGKRPDAIDDGDIDRLYRTIRSNSNASFTQSDDESPVAHGVAGSRENTNSDSFGYLEDTNEPTDALIDSAYRDFQQHRLTDVDKAVDRIYASVLPTLRNGNRDAVTVADNRLKEDTRPVKVNLWAGVQDYIKGFMTPASTWRYAGAFAVLVAGVATVMTVTSPPSLDNSIAERLGVPVLDEILTADSNLSDYMTASRTESMGFSESKTDAEIAYLGGSYAIPLSVATTEGFETQRVAIIERLSNLYESRPESDVHQLLAEYVDSETNQQIEKATAARVLLDSLIFQLNEQHVRTSSEPYFQLGVWGETMRLALFGALAGNDQSVIQSLVLEFAEIENALADDALSEPQRAAIENVQTSTQQIEGPLDIGVIRAFLRQIDLMTISFEQ